VVRHIGQYDAGLRAKASAVVRPMPLPAPVTNATLPAKLLDQGGVCAVLLPTDRSVG